MPVELRRRILARQLVRQGDWHPVLLIAAARPLAPLESARVSPQRRARNGDHAVFAALGGADGQLRGLQVHVLDSQVKRLAHAQAATVEQPHDQACGKKRRRSGWS